MANLPLRAGKGYQWEGEIREPYFMKVLWLVKAPKIISEPVTGAGFYPTILELANIRLKLGQHIDGINLLPLLRGGPTEERPLYWHYLHYGNQGGDPSSIMRQGTWKLIHYWEDGHDELYNLEQDLSEQNDVARDYSEKLSEMKKKYLQLLDEVDAKLPDSDINFESELAKVQYLEKKNEMLPRFEKERREMFREDFRPNETWWDSKITHD